MPTLGVYGGGLDANANSCSLLLLMLKLRRKKRAFGQAGAQSRKPRALSSLGSLKTSLASIEDALASPGNGSAFDALFRTTQAPNAVSVVKSGAATAGWYEIDIQTLAEFMQSLYGQTFEKCRVGRWIWDLWTISLLGQPSAMFLGLAGDYSGFSAPSNRDIVIDSSNNSVSGIKRCYQRC